MKKLVFSIAIVFAIFNAVIIPLDLVLIWSLVWAIFVNEKQGLYAALIGGFVLDLCTFSALGLHSVALLIGTAAVLILLRVVALPYRNIFLVIYLCLAFVIYNYILLVFQVYGNQIALPIAKLVVDSGIVCLIVFMLRKNIQPIASSAIRLKV